MLAPLGHTIDHTNPGRLYAYHTDLVPWYPGKRPRGNHDNPPTDAEIAECWHFFEREVALVEPRAVVVLGLPAVRAFLNRYTDQRIRRSARLADLGGTLHDATVAARSVPAVVAWHPSSAWGKFAAAADETYRAAQQLVAPLLDV